MDTPNTLSLKAIVDILYSISMNNLMVNDFFFGASYNIELTNRKYPLIVVEPTGTIINNAQLGSSTINTLSYSFNIYCLDKIMKGDVNYDELFNDTQVILQSLVSLIDQHQMFIDYQMSIQSDIQLQPIFEVEDDNLNGWMSSITFLIPNRYTPCNTANLPILSYTVSSGNNSVQYRLVGEQGPAGPAGQNGINGINGATGPIGPTGPAGATGSDGQNGATGATGERGATGPGTINTGTLNEIAYYATNGITISGTNSITNIIFQGGNSFGATMSIGTTDAQTLSFLVGNRTFLQLTGTGSNQIASFTGNTVATQPDDTVVWIQNSKSTIASESLLTTFNTVSSGAAARPHWRLLNGNTQSMTIGLHDNSETFTINRGNGTNLMLLTAGASSLSVSAIAGAQTSMTINAAHQNPSGTSIGLNVNNTGSNNTSGGVITLRVNNAQTLSGSGVMSLIEAQRSSNMVFRVNMAGAISAGTVSNATASSWKLGKAITAASVVDATKYIEVEIDSVVYKLAICS